MSQISIATWSDGLRVTSRSESENKRQIFICKSVKGLKYDAEYRLIQALKEYLTVNIEKR